MADEQTIIELDEQLEALRAKLIRATPQQSKRIAQQIEKVQAKRQALDTFCEREGCTRKSYGYKWCEQCHVAFETYLTLMVTGFVVCGHCHTSHRPGVLVFTKKCCPRCGFDLSDEEEMRRLDIATIIG